LTLQRTQTQPPAPDGASIVASSPERPPAAVTVAEPPTPLSELLSAGDLAKILNEPVGRVEVALRRYRGKYPDCAIETEKDRRRTDPAFMYRTKEVWPFLLKKKRDWETDQVTDE